MQVQTGRIDKLQNFENEMSKKDFIKKVNSCGIVSCPDSQKATNIMRTWGLNKRLTYAEFISESVKPHIAFYFVEYNGGKSI